MDEENKIEEEEDTGDLKLLKELLQEDEPEVEPENLNVVEVKPEEFPPEVNFPAPTPDIKTRIYTNYIFLKEFLDKDFNVDEPTMIDLKREKENEGFWFIIFLDETQSGRELLQRWLELAQIIKKDYLNLGYCNITFEKKIFTNFKNLTKIENIDHPFYWARYIQIPFMLVYRNYWPVGFYLGDLNQQALVNFVIDEASNPLVELNKVFKRRTNIMRETQIMESERKLKEGYKEEELRDKAFEEDKKRKDELKKIDFRNQEITRGVSLKD